MKKISHFSSSRLRYPSIILNQTTHPFPLQISEMTKAALTFLAALDPASLPSPSPAAPRPSLFIRLPEALLPSPPLPAHVRALLPHAAPPPLANDPDSDASGPIWTLDLMPHFKSGESDATAIATAAPESPGGESGVPILDESTVAVLSYSEQLELAIEQSKESYRCVPLCFFHFFLITVE